MLCGFTMKFKIYKEGPVTGLLTRKLDGVRGHYDGATWTSRAGKSLYNLPLNVQPGVYEIFTGSWESTISSVRSKSGTLVSPTDLYSLAPELDKRLELVELVNELPPTIPEGEEGFVLYPKVGPPVKIKRQETYDEVVLDLIEGTGQFEGKLGAFITARGKVGTGFTTLQREELYNTSYIGAVIEVECMEITSEGKFRHPRFKRMREDKK